MAVAASLATLDLLDRELIANAARMGEFILRQTAGWLNRHKFVGDIRGKGLMIGIEFVRDQKTKERAPEIRNRVLQAAFQRGLLVLGAGENTLRLAPPLIIDEEQAEFALRTLEGCISEVETAI